MCTLAAMGAVRQVLGTHGEALFVFLCGAIGGRIVARAFCYGHCVCLVGVYECVGCGNHGKLMVVPSPQNVNFFDFFLELRERKNAPPRGLLIVSDDSLKA